MKLEASGPRPDQRQSVRKQLHTHGTLLDGQEALRFQTTDIALEGMGVVLPRQLKKGQRYRIAFALIVDGQRRDVSAVVTVTHCLIANEGFKTGLRFAEINAAGAASIAQCMYG